VARTAEQTYRMDQGTKNGVAAEPTELAAICQVRGWAAKRMPCNGVYVGVV
jgi:hypothetical protein